MTSKKDLSERDICSKYINPALETVGWSMPTQIREEVSFTDGGILKDKISPKSVVRQAYASQYINDAETWLKMIGDRNLMSHTYDFAKFEMVIKSIEKSYLSILDNLYMELLEEINS